MNAIGTYGHCTTKILCIRYGRQKTVPFKLKSTMLHFALIVNSRNITRIELRIQVDISA